MTRTNRDPEVVCLSVSNWCAIAALVLAMLASGWKFTLDISGEIRAMEARLTNLERRLDAVER